MPTVRKPPNLTSDDIPLLEDVIEDNPPVEPQIAAVETAPEPATPPLAASEPPAAETIPLDILSEVLTERITALTDRLLRDASAEIHATLVNKVWERLREEIPNLIDEAIRENGGEN